MMPMLMHRGSRLSQALRRFERFATVFGQVSLLWVSLLVLKDLDIEEELSQ